jgi:hypothetical protein
VSDKEWVHGQLYYRVDSHLYLRHGHLWCTQHNKWWKDCPCLGQTNRVFTITKEIMDHVTPEAGAFQKAAEAALGEVRDLQETER